MITGTALFYAVRSSPSIRCTTSIFAPALTADEAAVCRRPCGTSPLEKSHRNGWSYTEIADRLGITKGRISQIRSTAPGPERALLRSRRR
ncbi:sigma factor-like helix-turn-helix DNA-binding protein [Nocardia tengchongensis]|uniref:sigma factor-like helix-turn-helix DNA-binding protein n=1 Tax=Nocardia tengchongensis TaxID=2055889 RepID=UPI00369B631D